MRQRIETGVGTVTVESRDDQWSLRLDSQEEAGLTLIKVSLEAGTPRTMAPVRVAWAISGCDIHYRWHPFAGATGCWLPPDWHSELNSRLAYGAPVVCLFGQDSRNRLTFAWSDALNPTAMRCGVREADGCISCELRLFETPMAPLSHYEAALRLDTRRIDVEKAVGAVGDWWASMPSYRPQNVPDAALHPLYSTWYSYHQDIHAGEVERECREAVDYGLRSVIVDDGWQMAEAEGAYPRCGDWRPAQNRFPDMRRHVNAVHALGLKYLLWYSVPWVGRESEAFSRFRGKTLYYSSAHQAAALDPRFPEVREYLVRTYEEAVRAWNLDGFKLDFIDSFRFADGVDPAQADGYAGRDFRLLSAAVDRLLSDVKMRLTALKPDILLEFRQHYVGPAMRGYGTMFRVNDCPGDIVANRMGVVNLRLLSGGTAVHGDMLLWRQEDTAEEAALQVLSVFFGVPQISVRLAELPASHRRMLSFYLGLWEDYRDVLLRGDFKVHGLELNAPVLSARKDGRLIAVTYASGQCLEVPGSSEGESCIINATADDFVLLQLDGEPLAAETYDAQGRIQASFRPGRGLQRLKVPHSGAVRIRY